MDNNVVQHVGASRPSIGFPLGTALLITFLLTSSAFFYCFSHWDKFKSSLRISSSSSNNNDTDLEADTITKMDSKQLSRNESVPVIVMPGDEIPKFIALPMPCPNCDDQAPLRYSSEKKKINNYMIEDDDQTVPPMTPSPPTIAPPPPPTILYNGHISVSPYVVYYPG